MAFLSKIGFHSCKQVSAFLAVVFSGQIVYAAFESLKIPFYEPVRQLLGLSHEQFGTMFTMLGVALFFYIPGGWVNNVLNVRTVLFWGLAWRAATGLILVIFLPPYPVLLALALSWGILDGMFWPAVVKGVALFAGAGNKAFGFGVLNGFRAGGEATLNAILIGIMALVQGSLFVLRVGMGVYACLAVVMMVLVWRFLPSDSAASDLTGDQVIAEDGRALNAKESIIGLLAVLRRVDMWLAGLAGMCVYWVYTTFVYLTPYLTGVHGASQSFASTFSIVAVVVVGLGAGLLGGLLADKVFHSATRMMIVAMSVDGFLLLGLRFVPVGPENLWLGVAAMGTMAFFTFMAKTIQQAPVTELGLPANVLGSAMSVNSFFGFASILWALRVNGSILDAHASDPKAAFDQIFLIIAVVAFAAAFFALMLEFVKGRRGGSQVGHQARRQEAPQ
ncbi:MAG: MFS transporter [Actinomycetaceae bacterium]|nr:MFS transporter [Actinomycetaceae bacterium]